VNFKAEMEKRKAENDLAKLIYDHLCDIRAPGIEVDNAWETYRALSNREPPGTIVTRRYRRVDGTGCTRGWGDRRY